MKTIILALVFIFCISCVPIIRTYRFGERLNFLEVKTGTQKQIQREYKKIKGDNPSKGLVGFYHFNTHTIYTTEDFDTLLHELWHAGGEIKEPYGNKE